MTVLLIVVFAFFVLCDVVHRITDRMTYGKFVEDHEEVRKYLGEYKLNSIDKEILNVSVFHTPSPTFDFISRIKNGWPTVSDFYYISSENGENLRIDPTSELHDLIEEEHRKLLENSDSKIFKDFDVEENVKKERRLDIRIDLPYNGIAMLRGGDEEKQG